MQRIWVVATEGRRVPMEGAPRRYVEQQPVEVVRSTYYMRRLAAGELREAAAPASSAAPNKEGN